VSRAVVRIPTPLRPFTGGADEVPVEGSTVGDALHDLASRHHGILQRVLDDDGRVRGFVNIYVGDRNIKALGGLQATLGDTEIISIVPAVAGGRA
jgi:molybdopterin converting factor small subunit